MEDTCWSEGRQCVNCLDQALKAAPKGGEVILLGDINMRLRDLRDNLEEDLVTALVGCGLVPMIGNFFP